MQKSVSATGEGIPETAEIAKSRIEYIGGKVSLEGEQLFPNFVFSRILRLPVVSGDSGREDDSIRPMNI
ncbi:MAG: hypothetical protein JXC33_05780 [Deltaproteobacteria bacterium]|nr:hypothetical protein [Deltaproteobacteria bacterium]